MSNIVRLQFFEIQIKNFINFSIDTQHIMLKK